MEIYHCIVFLCWLNIIEISCRDIYISPFGHNNETCGGNNSMCLSLDYALEQFSNSINVYLLDGGDDEEPYAYSFKQPIPINNSTTIKAMPYKRHYPKVSQIDNPWVYVFEVRSTCDKLALRQIQFTDSFIVLIDRGELIIEDCKINFTLHAPESSLISLWQDIRTVVLNVHINNCHINNAYSILDVSTFFQHNITLNVSNSTLISSRISIELSKNQGCNSNVNIKITNNSTISEPKVSRFMCISDGRRGNLIRLVNRECPGNATGKSVIQISDTEIVETTNMVMYVHGNVSVNIEYARFRNNKCGGIFLENIEAGSISHSEFLLNTKTDYRSDLGAINCASCKALNVSDTKCTSNGEGEGSCLYIKGEDEKVDITLQNVALKGPGTLMYSYNRKTIFHFDNVNVSCTSVENSKVLILAYTSLFMPLFRLTCSVNHDIQYDQSNVKYYSFWYCNACERDTYSTDSGYIFVENTNTSTYHVNCKECPLGLNCQYGATAKPNFWCFKESGTISCIPCPPGYCCPDTKVSCNSLRSCNQHRKGFICGSCVKEYQIDFFSNDCILSQSCKTPAIFWSGLCIAAFLYIALVAYLKDIFNKVKHVLSKCLSFESYPDIVLSNHDDDVFVQCRHVLYRDDSTGRFFGVYKICVSFYQLGALLRVKTIHRNDMLTIHTFLLTLFNLKIEQIVESFKRFCPIPNLDTVGKMLIRNICFPFLMFIMLGIILIILLPRKNEYEEIAENRIEYIDSKIPELESVPSVLRVKYCVLQVLLLSFTNIAAFLMNMLKCEYIGQGRSVLYVQGTTECYTRGWFIALVFLTIWVLPFGLAIYGAVILFKECYITLNEFICCFFFPPLMFIYYTMRKLIKKEKIAVTETEAMLSKYILSVFESPFRKIESKNRHVIWDPMIIYQRLVIISCTIFFVNAIERLSYILGPMLIFLVDHLRQRPYKDNVMHWMQTVSYVCLCFLVGVNSFWAFLYISSVPYKSSIRTVGVAFSIAESILFTLPLILPLLFLAWKLIKLLKEKIFNKRNETNMH
ncbi:uncharacterized protein LOC130645174 [Hydractinia symbiolongicarpus]|uniref:uncharacterized protein LOC130645174 n=1 Tax=Hydractinia symbiolongicarpus TaxID=13093 RepID=UPI00254B6E85|nr:uncharacterized protein LOC130645174 [Hydractinia symbiolongicarpus]XP_057307052.1 uncharacterized protein LOC130645174 [Hydractinia symbiolongicarpus]